MCVNNLPKVATQWNSGAPGIRTRGRRVLIPSALTTTPPTNTRRIVLILAVSAHVLLIKKPVRVNNTLIVLPPNGYDARLMSGVTTYAITHPKGELTVKPVMT